MKTTWQRDFKASEFGTLKKNLDTDVVIIGGGITGSTVAYELARIGIKTIVLEKESLANSSTTAYTTAFLT